uniref:Protocadherin alpha 5 n=2 Tax=Ornithorhynchus anatinus TaxID=9258 RepID=A0A6I8NIF0_ORNAN
MVSPRPAGGGPSRPGTVVDWVVTLCLCISGISAEQLDYSVSEETGRGVVVGNVAQDLGLDAAGLPSRGLLLLPGANDPYFAVEPGSGAVVVREPADRERLCGARAPCVLSYELLLQNPLELHRMRVRVLDVNDHSPRFPAGEVQLHIAEFVAPGARFALPDAQDADEGSNGLRDYALSPSDHFLLEMGTRGDGSQYPELVLDRALDRERQAAHRLRLTARDGGQPPRSGEVRVTVTVVDTNDNAPVFERPVYRAGVPETAPIGTLLTQVRASDPDEGSNGEIRYAFGPGTDADLRRRFHVHPRNGEVRVAAPLGAPDPGLEIFIEARDGGALGLAGTTKLLVEVTDVNDHVPEVRVLSLSSPVPEDAGPGTVVALLSVRDDDPGPNGRVTCSLLDGGDGGYPFQLRPSFDNYFTLLTTGPLDRERVSEYHIPVMASDGGSPPLSSSGTVTILVADVNDNAPSFSRPQQELLVAENNSPGASLGRVLAQDPDLGDNGRVSYVLRELDSKGPPASSLVEVESASGAITAKAPFDFESLREFRFQVEARDGGVPSRSANVTVKVSVLDRNDNAPVILHPPARNGSIPVEVVPRSAGAGHLVAKVVAEDLDSGPNAWLSYHLLQASVRDLFEVAPRTGELRTVRSLRPGDAAKQKVVVMVRDHGEPPLSSTVTVGVLLADSIPHVLPDFNDDWGRRGQLSGPNLYLVIALATISFVFLGCVISLLCINLNQDRARCPSGCCPARCCSTQEYRYQRKVPPSSSFASAQVDVTAVGRLSQTYLYQASLGLGPSHDNFLLRGECSAADLRNLACGVGFNLPVSFIQVRNRKGEQGHANAVAKQPNPDWRYSASLRAGMHSSVHLEEAGILHGRLGGPDQQWPTVSSATTEPEAGEVSPPVGAGVNSNSWTFKYGPSNPKQSGPGELPDKFIIPGSPAIISIRQEPPNNQIDKSDFITFGKKEETKKKKKKKKGNKAQEKKEKGNSTTDNSDQ